MKYFKMLCVVLCCIFIVASCTKEGVIILPPDNAPAYKLSDFTSAKACSTCHPTYYDEWNGSMHRYSTSDPIWRLANNSLQASTNGRLDKTCFQCHAPIGFLTGNTKQVFEFTDLPDLVREGITCDFCHVLRSPFVTTNQYIQYNVRPGRKKYGALDNPVGTPAHEHGFDETYDRSDVCRPCHDLIVNNVPVEITNTEWQNSPWGAMSVECEKCHMPTYTGKAAVGGPVRQNLHRHDFVGVDVTMTDFPGKEHQRAVADSLLKNSVTMNVNIPASALVTDTVTASVNIYNDKVGHNVPTSVFFFRQMWIELTVWNGTDTVYRSGHLDENGDLRDTNSVHHPKDKDLVMFGGTLYKNGQFSNVFELDSLVNKSIPPFASPTAYYRFNIEQPGTWYVNVRLLFRPFGPYLFRSLGANELINQIPVFEMATFTRTISVN